MTKDDMLADLCDTIVNKERSALEKILDTAKKNPALVSKGTIYKACDDYFDKIVLLGSRYIKFGHEDMYQSKQDEYLTVLKQAKEVLDTYYSSKNVSTSPDYAYKKRR